MLEFSIVIPTYNRKLLIGELVERLLDLDYDKGAYEVIIIDDASTDGTTEMMKRYEGTPNFRYEKLAGNSGQSLARNVGIKLARGSVVAFTDSDCLPPRDWLTRLGDLFKKFGGAVGVGGVVAPRVSDSIITRFLLKKVEISYESFPEPYVVDERRTVAPVTNNVAYLREALIEMKGFCEYMRAGEDPDLNRRLMEQGYTIVMDTSLAMTHNEPDTLKEFWRRRANRGSGVFPTLLRKGLSKKYLVRKTALESIKLAMYFVPVFWPLLGLYLIWLASAQRAYFAIAASFRETLTVFGLVVLDDLAFSAGFFTGVREYLKTRRSPRGDHSTVLT